MGGALSSRGIAAGDPYAMQLAEEVREAKGKEHGG
jgi:hypothetical protein